MYNLVRADMYNLHKSMTTKVLICITILSAAAVVVLSQLTTHGNAGSNIIGVGALLSDVQMMTLLGSMMSAIMICGGFENKTIQSSVSYGNSRGIIVAGKALSFFISIAVILLPYIIVTVAALCTGIEFNKPFSASLFQNIITSNTNRTFTAPVLLKITAALLTITIVHTTRLSICVLFAFLFRKPILAIGVSYSVSLLCGNMATIPLLKGIFDYTPFSGNTIGITLNTGYDELLKIVVISLTFAFIIVGITYLVFKKSEVK